MLGALNSDIYPSLTYGTVALLSTAASLMMIPSSLIAGAMVGKAVRYKTLAIVSALLILLGGIGPFFVTAFPFALLCRMIVGLGIGITFPLQNTLIPGLFEEERRPALFGAGSAIMSVTGILYQIISGYAVSAGATVPWLIHGIMIIPLLLILLFLREPDQKVKETADVQTAVVTEKMPGRCIFIFFAHALLFMASYPILLNISLIMEYGNYGSTALGGTISSMWTVGGVLAGLIFGGIAKKAGKFTVPIGCMEWAVGTGILAIANNVSLLFIGTLICGVAVQTCWPGTMNNYGKYVPASKLGVASALYTSGMCLGCFLSSYFTTFAQRLAGSDNPQAPLRVGFVIALATAVVWSFLEITVPSERLAEKNK